MTLPLPDSSDNPADWALLYTALGWRVVPCYPPVFTAEGVRCSCQKGAKCKDPGKHPRLMGWPEEATTDTKMIQEWWRKWPDSNVGIVTGAASGLVVIDVDPRNGGEESLADVEGQLGPLPATVEALSGGGGRHLVFVHPGGFLPSSNGVWPGIDVKGDGGFIVAARSMHESGRRYEWESSSMPGDVALAALPRPWIDALRVRSAHRYGTERTETTEGRPSPPSALSVVSVVSIVSVPLPDWVSPELRQSLESTLPTSPGRRNARTMDLGRLLRFHSETRDRPLHELRPIVYWWHAEACKRTTIAATADDEWDNFVRAHGLAELPLGDDLFVVALAATRDGPFPERALQCYTDPRRWHLAAACRWMQSWTGDGDFSLSVEQVNRAFDLRSKRSSWDWLNALVRDKLLVSTRPAPPGPPGSPASRWRWAGENPG